MTENEPCEPFLQPPPSTVCRTFMTMVGAGHKCYWSGTGCCHRSHCNEGSLFAESLAPDWKPQGGCISLHMDGSWSVPQLPEGWKSKDLAIWTALKKVVSFPTKIHMVENSSNTGRSTETGRPQFVMHMQLTFSPKVFFWTFHFLSCWHLVFC